MKNTKAKLVKHFVRENVYPPERFLDYKIIPFHKRDSVLNLFEDLTAVQTLEGLLEYGGVMRFPGGTGLDYQAPYKEFYIPEYTKLAREKIGTAAEKLGANCIIAPDIAALFWAKDIAEIANIPIIRVLKDGKQTAKYYQGSIKSYTKGTQDIMYIKSTTLQSLMKFTKGEIRFFFADEIADTGKMLDLISDMVKSMQEDGIKVKLIGAGVLIEKVYTGVRKRLEAELDIPLISGLKTTDMWCKKSSKTPAAVAIKGIDGVAFAFNKQKVVML